MPSRRKQEYSTFAFYSVLVITLLLLSALNIQVYLQPKVVLGVETETNTDDVFWANFLEEHPNYIPGWIELGRFDKVKQIDPNYLLQP
jgi:hypothetical protein